MVTEISTASATAFYICSHSNQQKTIQNKRQFKQPPLVNFNYSVLMLPQLLTQSLCFLGSYLFQLFQNLVCTHPAGQQLLNHTLGFSLLSFFSRLSICNVATYLGVQGSTGSDISSLPEMPLLFRPSSEQSSSLSMCSFALQPLSGWMRFRWLKVVICSCFSAIWDAQSLVVLVLGRFLLPFVLGMVITSFLLQWFKYSTIWICGQDYLLSGIFLFPLCDVIFFTVLACVYCSIAFIPSSTPPPPVAFEPPPMFDI